MANQNTMEQQEFVEPTLARWREKQYPISYLQDNPKGFKSFVRYEGYKGATTIAMALASGATNADLKWDFERDFIILHPPPEPKIVKKEKKITDKKKRKKSYAEMSTDELEWMESEILEALRDKRKINDSSDQFMVIGAEFRGPETFYKIDKTKYSKDLADYVVKGGYLYHKGEKVKEGSKVECEGEEYRTKEIYWAPFSPFDDEE